MTLNINDRTLVYIDSFNLYKTFQSFGTAIDYGKMLNFFRENTNLTRANLYSLAYPNNDNENYNDPSMGIKQWCANNGYDVITPAGVVNQRPDGSVHLSGDVSIQMSVDMIMSLTASENINNVVIMSSKSNIIPALKAAKSFSVKTTVINSSRGGSFVSDELNREADIHIDLDDIRHHFQRDMINSRRRDLTDDDVKSLITA